jgi:hypothetical protein
LSVPFGSEVVVMAKPPDAAVPVPVSASFSGESAALSVKVMKAERAPSAVGVKVKLRTQEPLAARFAPLMQVVVFSTAKSPGFVPPSTLTFVRVSAAVPVFVSVTGNCPLVVLMV